MKHPSLLALVFVLSGVGCTHKEEVLDADKAPVGSMTETDACQRKQGDLYRVISDSDGAPMHMINTVRVSSDWSPECFTEEDISTVRKAWYNHQHQALRQGVLECRQWQYGASTLKEIEEWRDFPEVPNQAGGRELIVYFQPDIVDHQNNYWELVALNASCESDPQSFDMAMTSAGLIQDPAQRTVTENEVTRRFYVAKYRGGLTQTGEYTIERLVQRYPLETFWGTFTFAERMALESKPMPNQFILDYKLDQAMTDERIQAQFLRHRGDDAVKLAQDYVEDGHDPVKIYTMALESLLHHRQYTLAIQVAHEHLDARQVTLVEDARIAHLDATGGYSVLNLDGRRVRLYPMYNEGAF